MAFLVGGANSAVSGYNIENSLRFNDGDSPVLTREFSGDPDGDRKTFTISVWVKRSSLSFNQAVVSAQTTSTFYDKIIGFRSTDNLEVSNVASNADAIGIITNRLYRDVSAWYHIVVAIDTTQAAIGDGVKFYVNGVRDTDYDGTPVYTQNATFEIGRDGSTTAIGRLQSNSTQYLDGYLSEFYFIDGTQEAQTAFGEFDEDSGIWKPKAYTGSYGANGFFLEFKKSAVGTGASDTIGADTSGQDEHFTSSGIAVTDQTTDTPTNNFCTLNSTYKDDGNNTVVADYSEGNTKMLTTVDAWKFGRGTFSLTSGKWYAEVKATEAGNGETGNFGIVPSQGGVVLGHSDDNDVFEGSRITFSSSSTDLLKMDTGTGSVIFDDFASGNTAHLAIDLDNNKIWVGKEGTWYNDDNASTTLDASNHDVALPTVTEGWLFGVGQSRNGSDNVTYEYNWGNPPNAISSGNADANGYGNFEFAVPSGFYAVCTKNLAEFG